MGLGSAGLGSVGLGSMGLGSVGLGSVGLGGVAAAPVSVRGPEPVRFRTMAHVTVTSEAAVGILSPSVAGIHRQEEVPFLQERLSQK